MSEAPTNFQQLYETEKNRTEEKNEHLLTILKEVDDFNDEDTTNDTIDIKKIFGNNFNHEILKIGQDNAQIIIEELDSINKRIDANIKTKQDKGEDTTQEKERQGEIKQLINLLQPVANPFINESTKMDENITDIDAEKPESLEGKESNILKIYNKINTINQKLQGIPNYNELIKNLTQIQGLLYNQKSIPHKKCMMIINYLEEAFKKENNEYKPLEIEYSKDNNIVTDILTNLNTFLGEIENYITNKIDPYKESIKKYSKEAKEARENEETLQNNFNKYYNYITADQIERKKIRKEIKEEDLKNYIIEKNQTKTERVLNLYNNMKMRENTITVKEKYTDTKTNYFTNIIQLIRTEYHDEIAEKAINTLEKNTGKNLVDYYFENNKARDGKTPEKGDPIITKICRYQADFTEDDFLKRLNKENQERKDNILHTLNNLLKKDNTFIKDDYDNNFYITKNELKITQFAASKGFEYNMILNDIKLILTNKLETKELGEINFLNKNEINTFLEEESNTIINVIKTIIKERIENKAKESNQPIVNTDLVTAFNETDIKGSTLHGTPKPKGSDIIAFFTKHLQPNLNNQKREILSLLKTGLTNEWENDAQNPSYDAIITLQSKLNELNTNTKIYGDKIKEDGQFGNNTFTLLKNIFEKSVPTNTNGIAGNDIGEGALIENLNIDDVTLEPLKSTDIKNIRKHVQADSVAKFFNESIKITTLDNKQKKLLQLVKKGLTEGEKENNYIKALQEELGGLDTDGKFGFLTYNALRKYFNQEPIKKK